LLTLWSATAPPFGANDSVYGLAAAGWTQDLSRAHRLAKQLQAGTVWLNAQFASDPAMPFGGYKQSGWGYEYGLEGVEAYMQTKAVYTRAVAPPSGGGWSGMPGVL
jgi:phenylacetaldehyde dehydrogenase